MYANILPSEREYEYESVRRKKRCDPGETLVIVRSFKMNPILWA